MKLLILFIATTTLLLSQTRIINGTQVPQNDSKWESTVALVTDPSNIWQSQFCGGTLIANQWVLTAAHCVPNMAPNNLYVYYGNYALPQGSGNTVAIEAIVSHPQYNDYTTDNDIALLKLSTPITSITPMNINPNEPIADTGAYVAGWGNMSTTSTDWPDTLMEAYTPIVNFSTCNENYTFSGSPLSDNMFCAGYFVSYKDSCQGDSGGPLITYNEGEYQLTGIVSWGNGCAQDDYPGVYTKISNYTAWIDSHVNAEETPWEPDEETVAYCQNNPSACGITVSESNVSSWSTVTPRQSIINATQNQTFDIKGYYIQYNSGAFDWIYISSSKESVYKLEKGSDENGYLRWTDIQTPNNLTYDSIMFSDNNATVTFGNQIPGR
jgi:secreted trypsin-like serine protease